MNLYLVRHGQTDYNLQGRIQGGLDIPLNDQGIQQAGALASACVKSGVGFDAIYSSTKLRAKATAAIISDRLGLPYTELAGTEEINLGRWQGLTWEEVKQQYYEDYIVWYDKRRYTPASDGESYQDMMQRVIRALEDILAKDHKDVLLVTHSAVIMCLLSLIHETPFNKMTDHKPDNTAMTVLDSEAIALLFKTFNRSLNKTKAEVTKEKLLVSACLIGEQCRYDGTGQMKHDLYDLLLSGAAIPVCPEVLGGLSTPRTPCEIQRVKSLRVVMDRDGVDRTDAFIKGAHETLKIGQQNCVTRAVLKARSPSCGCGRIYDGSFSGTLIPGNGLTAELLLAHGIQVYNEDNYKDILPMVQ